VGCDPRVEKHCFRTHFIWSKMLELIESYSYFKQKQRFLNLILFDLRTNCIRTNCIRTNCIRTNFLHRKMNVFWALTFLEKKKWSLINAWRVFSSTTNAPTVKNLPNNRLNTCLSTIIQGFSTFSGSTGQFHLTGSNKVRTWIIKFWSEL